jgi:hydroxycarboxylate dehydrogenase B
MEAAGCPPDEALTIGDALSDANLAGHDSHGLIRVEQYVKMVRTGEIVPGAPTTVLQETPSMAVLDGGWNFGQVVGRRAVELAMRKAREGGTGTVSVRNANHLGRLGAYPMVAAEAGMLCLATVNNNKRGNLVAPFGGSDGRLATNPIAFACPGPERPILVDITTSVVAEGKVRILKNAGKRAPEGWLMDNQGRPTTDPNDLYTEPRGAILPFGGPVAHKGFALAIMVDILSGALSGSGCSQGSTGRLGNAMFFFVAEIERFGPRLDFDEQVKALVDHVRASPPAPGFNEIIIPGEPELRQAERRRREGMDVDDETWRQFTACAASLGVDAAEIAAA